HLFEHMMFQGSANAPKMQHIKLVNSSGGMLNGSTSYDVTNYYEAVPSNALERVLWLEADRRRALKVDDENLKNQRDVVKEEVRRSHRAGTNGRTPRDRGGKIRDAARYCGRIRAAKKTHCRLVRDGLARSGSSRRTRGKNSSRVGAGETDCRRRRRRNRRSLRLQRAFANDHPHNSQARVF